jgi:predicted RNA binding protein YcfA (HicA-like mRNA interferase family)
MKPREVVSRLKADGWLELSVKMTSHRQFRHPAKSGKVTVPDHPVDINPITLKNIEKQSGVSMK